MTKLRQKSRKLARQREAQKSAQKEQAAFERKMAEFQRLGDVCARPYMMEFGNDAPELLVINAMMGLTVEGRDDIRIEDVLAYADTCNEPHEEARLGVEVLIGKGFLRRREDDSLALVERKPVTYEDMAGL